MADEWDERRNESAATTAGRCAGPRQRGCRSVCLEVGSGTGLATPNLVEHFNAVIGLDLSPRCSRWDQVPEVLGDANGTHRLPAARSMPR